MGARPVPTPGPIDYYIPVLCLIKDFEPAKFDPDQLRDKGEIVGKKICCREK